MDKLTKRLLALLTIVAMALSCTGTLPEQPSDSDNREDVENPGDNPGDNTDDPNDPDNPDDPDKPDKPDNPDPDDPDKPDNPGDDDPDPVIEILDPGEEKVDVKPAPQHPELEHNVEYDDFYSDFYDYLDEYGNIDYVCSQGNGTAWPLLLENGHIRFYQSSNADKGGNYMRVRSKNGAKLMKVTIGTATATKIAHSVNGKAAKSETAAIDAEGTYTVTAPENCDEICFYCMGTTQTERWELNYIKVEYKGGFIEDDFYTPEKEYGPLVKTSYPFKENFEKGFPTTDKPSYYKYGLTAGRENLEWSTWYGSFSWQKPLQGGQSAQLRVYQEEEDYDQPQFGHLKMEFFLKDLKQVNFSYLFSEFWQKATISFCEFGETKWQNPQQISLGKYGDRGTVQSFTYILDNGTPHDAKIRIEIDEATGFPTKDHYDFYFDCFVFE